MPNLSWFKERAKSIKRIIISDNKNKTKSDSSVNVSNDKISKDEIVRRQTNQFVPESGSSINVSRFIPESVSDKNEISDESLDKFVKRLEIDQFLTYSKYNKNDLKKFYDFAGDNFEWPVTMKVPERRVIINHIIRYNKEIGQELAKNAIAFRRLYEENKIDPTKGSHVLIVNGEIKSYENEFSWEKYRELDEKYPGIYFVPTIEKPIVLRRVEARNDEKEKSWVVNIWLRDQNDDVVDDGYSMIIDSGSTMTVIPDHLRKKLRDPNIGWSKVCKYSSGYADGERGISKLETGKNGLIGTVQMKSIPGNKILIMTG
ncbi:hypothetical protein GLOIN_2v1717333 [Rhizophagus clarus]|uniref:Uncharacterized protein n=1 Tax=Rhizophagus clarus TaxID=94130 RepID=A0A8H3L8L4_9GLOM|nr:hypothetical protein GLOIN_2v1717333 [Rhizophagus clarus]